jgi:hypothetical protein
MSGGIPMKLAMTMAAGAIVFAAFAVIAIQSNSPTHMGPVLDRTDLGRS